MRVHLGERLGLIPEDVLAFVWVVDFPLLEYSEEERRYVAKHHPFTAPRDEDLPILQTDPGRVRAKAYDLVLNGRELGGGSIRIHRRETQELMFQVLGMSKDETLEQFKPAGCLSWVYRSGTRWGLTPDDAVDPRSSSRYHHTSPNAENSLPDDQRTSAC